MKKYLATFFILSFLILGHAAFAATDTSDGFLNSTLWFSPASFADGDTVHIHAAVWNDGTTALSVNMQFTDGSTLLATRTVSISAGSLKDVSIPWGVTAGDHSIGAKIVSATTTVNGKATPVTLSNDEITTKSLFVPAKVSSAPAASSTASSVGQSVTNILPPSIASGVASTENSVDTFRTDTGATVNQAIVATQKKIATLNNPTLASSTANSTSQTEVKGTSKATAPTTTDSSISGTEKPIAYLELFLLQVAAFILNNSYVFYGIIIILVFLILRAIFRKVRRR